MGERVETGEGIWGRRHHRAYIAGFRWGRRGATAPLRLNSLEHSELKRRYYYELVSVRRTMSNLIVSISVADDSTAAKIIREWKKEGVNISAKVGMLIEECQDQKVYQLEARLGHIEHVLRYNRSNGMWKELFE